MRNPLSKFVGCVKLNYLGRDERDVHCIEKTKILARKHLIIHSIHRQTVLILISYLL